MRSGLREAVDKFVSQRGLGKRQKLAPDSFGAYYFSTLDRFGVYSDNSLVFVCVCIYRRKRAEALCQDGKKEACGRCRGSIVARLNRQPVEASEYSLWCGG